MTPTTPTMSDEHPMSNVVPILTEVVLGITHPSHPPAGETGAAAHTVAHAAEAAARDSGYVMDEEALVEQVMERLEKQIDHMFDYRVREAVRPVLERMADQIVTDVRMELSSTLRDIVRRSINQEIVRQRQPRK